jgi:hypothetical protein
MNLLHILLRLCMLRAYVLLVSRVTRYDLVILSD